MYDAMASGFATDLAQASYLFRIVPLSILDRINRSMMRAAGGMSFVFSYVNKGYAGRTFCDAGIQEVIHTPRVAINPGIGIFFTQFDGKISLTLSFLDGLLTPEEADRYVESLRVLLVPNSRNKFQGGSQ